jgi:transcriptional regulator with PAS, ATPase and Fis domain
MARILVIAPYQGLADLFEEASLFLNKKIDIRIGDLYKGLSLAKELEGMYDIIISRGATARLIRQHCSIPVIEVKISGYDILRTLTLVKGYHGKIGIMSYFNTIQGADTIGTLLDIDLSFYSIEQEEEIEKGIKKAVNDRVQVIVGDVITTSMAVASGLNAILITSGRESVLESIEEAEQMAFYTQKERSMLGFYKAVSNSFHEALVAVNEKGEIQIFNQRAEKVFGIKQDQVIGQNAALINPFLDFNVFFNTDRKNSESISALNGDDYYIRKSPLFLEGHSAGGVAVLEEVAEVQRVESRIRQAKSPINTNAAMHFSQFVAISENLKEQVGLAHICSRNNSSLLIYGEPGTGKKSLAEAIHNESSRREYPFVFLNCEAYTPEQLEAELFGFHHDGERAGAFEIAHNGTLFIDAMGKMPLSVQAKLINVLQENKVTPVMGDQAITVNVRLISAHSSDLKQEIHEGNFREDLFHLISKASFVLPPLRERKEDLPELVRWFIAFFNSKSGKQIVGLRPDVLSSLIKADWPGNVQQLRNIVERMCMASVGPFIETDQVADILEEVETEGSARAFKKNVIDITGKTLEELEREIISRVMEEEDHNQSHAAKKLGINRSTLWRKLKITP